MIDQCRFSCHSVCPERVRITSAGATSHSVFVQWISPLDENGVPYDVRIEVSYQEPNKTVNRTIIASSVLIRVWLKNIPSDTPVKLSLAAVNKQSKAGPTIRTTIKTKEPC